MDWLGIFGSYDFVIRTGLSTVLVAYGAYVLLRSGTFAVPQIGFMAIGSYAGAICSVRLGWPFWLDAVVGIASGMVVALVLGLILMNLDGIRLAIATVAFAEIVVVLSTNLGITGGAVGITGVPVQTADWELLLAVVLCVVGAWRLGRTRFGQAMDALRLDSLVASHQGVSIRAYRLAEFGLSGVLCAAGGVLQVHTTGFVAPTLFAFTNLTQIVAIVVLGGMTSFYGPLLGAMVILGVPQVLTVLQNYQLVFNGVVIVLIMAAAPGGLAALLIAAWRAAGSRTRRTDETAKDDGLAAPLGMLATRPRDEAVEKSRLTLSVKDVAKRFGGVRALDGISLEVSKGELFGIIGPNGSGKTTLLNILSGITAPDRGEIAIGGVLVRRSQLRADKIARLGVSRTFQGIRLLRDMTVYENVLLGTYHIQSLDIWRSCFGISGYSVEQREAAAEVNAAIDRLGISKERTAKVDRLPYGIQRRAEIARASVQCPRVMLLDEPTAGMSTEETAQIFRYLKELSFSGCTVIVVEHDLAAMSAHCDRIAVMNDGRLLALGDPSTVMTREEVIEAYVGRGERTRSNAVSIPESRSEFGN